MGSADAEPGVVGDSVVPRVDFENLPVGHDVEIVRGITNHVIAVRVRKGYARERRSPYRSWNIGFGS